MLDLGKLMAIEKTEYTPTTASELARLSLNSNQSNIHNNIEK